MPQILLPIIIDTHPTTTQATMFEETQQTTQNVLKVSIKIRTSRDERKLQQTQPHKVDPDRCD